MKYKMAFLTACVLLSLSAFAEECEFRAALIDLRDNGIAFEDHHKVFITGVGPEVSHCNTIVRATNLPAPRSKIYQDFLTPIDIESFTQTINISNISLRGYGELKFMSLDFISLNSEISRLDLYVAPGTIPKGSNEASNYFLSGIWTSFDVNGVEVSRKYFLTPAIRTSLEVSLKWQTTNIGMYNEGMKLDLDLVTSVVPISVYPQPGVPAGSPLGQQKFFPTGKTIGSLAQTSLVPQSSFMLDSKSSCIRMAGAANAASCD